MFDKIVVAIDESEHADNILNSVAAIATKFGSDLRVLHVLETGFIGRAGMVNLEDSDGAHKIVNEAVAFLVEKGLRATGNLRSGLHGRLAIEINDEAHTFGAQLIVVGSRGLTDLEGLFVGSTTHRLMHITDLPVLVVP